MTATATANSVKVQTIYRVEKNANYSKVTNDLWSLEDLSVGARFTLGYMLSKPDDWQFYVEVMAQELHVNKDTVASYVNELIVAGYIKRERRREYGRFAGWTYYVYEDGQAVDASTHAESTISENTVSGELGATKTYLTNTDSNKKQEDDDIYTTCEKVSVITGKGKDCNDRKESDYSEEPFDIFQQEIYEQAQEHGFPAHTARLFALRCKGVMVTANTIHAAFVALYERMNDRTQPRIVSLPAYYQTTLKDEVGRQEVMAIHQEKERWERERKQQEAVMFQPYNWLNDNEEVINTILE